MEKITIAEVVTLATYITVLFGVIRLVVSPFTKSIDKITGAVEKNEVAMKSLEKSLDRLSMELDASKEDRKGIHAKIDEHEKRITTNEKDIAVLKKGE